MNILSNVSEISDNTHMEPINVEFTRNRKDALEAYYDIAGLSDGRFGFLSPVKLTSWLESATDWMCDAEFVAEVGGGYGEFVERTLQKCSTCLRTYYLIDTSIVMLDRASRRTHSIIQSAHSQSLATQVAIIKRDIAEDGEIAQEEIAANSLDKVVAINVFQDVDVAAALKNIHKLLRPGGFLRATFIKRETQDLFWEGDENYDAQKGCLYNFSALHEESEIPPLGYVVVNKEKKPFYRVQSYLKEQEIAEHLARTGYELVSMEPINYPTELVLKRWSSGFARTELNERQKSYLEEWGGFPDAWDVIAKK